MKQIPRDPLMTDEELNELYDRQISVTPGLSEGLWNSVMWICTGLCVVFVLVAWWYLW